MKPEDKALYEFLFMEDEVPEGYYSVKDIAEATGASTNAVAWRMKEMARTKKADCLELRRYNGRMVVKVRYYKIL